ncbi:methyltransferase domain-containing protein [Parvibaculum sp.]|uniref:class I SAM-dependent methyltransferase n=1 Tax=Parvibaculum sp. TaxID=2024848 RepID=UPI000C8C1614|nr:methyltransferase domain-containing protein [Parvibaculum sp.]MAB15163.1 SAM-dependent methyltransferase [Parvibaculum sp.]
MSEQTSLSNDDQIKYWNGRSGEKWVANQARMDRVLAPYSQAVIETLAPEKGERAIDIGCGCGVTTRAIAERTGKEGLALGVDVSRPMIEHARALAAAENNPAEFLLADASSHIFDGPGFDMLASRFGVMFFADPDAAFAHLHGTMKPGGRLAFVCWRPLTENSWFHVPLFAALEHVEAPEPPAPGAPGPFAFQDKDRVNAILSGAGFGDISIDQLDAEMTMGRTDSDAGDAVEDALHQSLEVGPFSRLFVDLDDTAREKAIGAVRKALAAHNTDRGVVLNGSVWLVTANA